MFEVIHEFAILGTAFFMMALATIWYSPMLFGKIWISEAGLTPEKIESAQPDIGKHMVLIFVSYTVMLGFLAYIVAYAPLLSMTPLTAAVYLALFMAAAMVVSVLSEGRSVRYYAVSVGFNTVFILLGTVILQYWPW